MCRTIAVQTQANYPLNQGQMQAVSNALQKRQPHLSLHANFDIFQSVKLTALVAPESTHDEYGDLGVGEDLARFAAEKNGSEPRASV